MWRFLLKLQILLGLLGAATALQAEIVLFSLDPARSILSSDAVLAALERAPLTAQDAAETSLTTSYTGTIELDVDDPLSPFLIQFTSANLMGQPSGEWLPEVGGGSVGEEGFDGDADPGLPAEANYGYLFDAGFTATGYFALRDMAFTITSEPLFVSMGSFTPVLSMAATQGFYDFNFSSQIAGVGDVAGRDDVTGEAGDVFEGEGSYVVQNSRATLTVPIEATFGEGDSFEVTFTGMLVATASFGGGAAIPGDYNNSGLVEQGDLDLVLGNWGADGANAPATWVNYPPVGIVDQEELDAVLGNWGSQAGSLATAESVPEPTTLILLLLAPTPLIARLRW